MGGTGRMSYVVLLAIYATLVYDVISATNSSPQTTEINASKRAETLMKWVHIGLAQAAVFVVLGAYIARSSAPLVGGGLAGVALYAQYRHARSEGMRKGGAETEVVGGYG